MDEELHSTIMLADTRRLAKPNLTTIVYYPNEVFVQSPLFPDYWIGNYGTIYDIRVGLKVNPRIGNMGYLTLAIRYTGLKRQQVNTSEDYLKKQYCSNMPLHRAIMLAHAPIPNYVEMQVNHIDGNKRRNVYLPGSPLNNLEWVTPQRNIQHSWEHGMSTVHPLKGEDSANAKYTNAQARIVCEVYSNGGTEDDAILALGKPLDDWSARIFVRNIRLRLRWTSISDEYDFPIVHYNIQHTAEDVELLCQLYRQSYSLPRIVEIMASMGHPMKYNCIKNILYRTPEKWLSITMKYGIPEARFRAGAEDSNS